jgi:hypothetical protein
VITWTPIDHLPADLKDGRDVLLWEAGFGPAGGGWGTYWNLSNGPARMEHGWIDREGERFATVSHYAEINEP